MSPQAGDVLLVKTDHLVSRLIRFGQRSYGKDAAQWNHVALCVGDGMIVEALTGGVVLSRLDKYPPENTRLITAGVGLLWPSDQAMRANAARFARACVGETYGWVTIAAIALKVLVKGRWTFGVQGTTICSGLVARSLERLGYIWNPYDPAELTPAYLAKLAD